MKTLMSLFFTVGCCLISIGCGGNSEAESRAILAMAHFENAESHFSNSVTVDQLIVNAGWVDRMGEAIQELTAIRTSESDTMSLIQEIRVEMLSRYHRRRSTLESDAAYLNAMHELKLSEIWLDL
jgi:hypothetical protein